MSHCYAITTLLCHIDNVVAIISLCLFASVGSPLHHVVIGVVIVTLLHHVAGVVIGSSCCWCYY